LLRLGLYNAHYIVDSAYVNEIMLNGTEKGNTEVLGANPFPVPISPSKISPRIALDQTSTYALKWLVTNHLSHYTTHKTGELLGFS